jgi:hypothetical protein
METFVMDQKPKQRDMRDSDFSAATYQERQQVKKEFQPRQKMYERPDPSKKVAYDMDAPIKFNP